jgi:hypothetical protein
MGRITFKETAFFRGEQREPGTVMDGVSEAETKPFTVGEKPLAEYIEPKEPELKDYPLERLQATAAAQGIETDGLNKTELIKKLKG